jgi:hypothetical protein
MRKTSLAKAFFPDVDAEGKYNDHIKSIIRTDTLSPAVIAFATMLWGFERPGDNFVARTRRADSK